MLIEKLIEELQKFPTGTNVCLLDHKKNLGDCDEDGSSVGVYPNFEIELMSLETDEREYYQERNDCEFKDWVAISFDNDDYDEDGKLVAE